MNSYDGIIIGAGPAGLTAATYLARYRRSVLVLDGGPSRAGWIPESHNTPGFPDGLGGAALLSRWRAQALEFGAEIREGLVTSLSREAEAFTATTSCGPVRASGVILATGVVDRVPPIPGIEDAIHASLVRICPICDAYEAIDKRIAVLGDGPLAVREAEFLTTYSRDVTILAVRGDSMLPPGALAIDLGDLAIADDAVQVLRDGRGLLAFDHLYLALGCNAQGDLAVALGAVADDTGNLSVDTHQMTSVTGLYAAGDVVRGLNQIAVANGEAAIAATALHNRLRRRDANGQA